MFSVMSVCSWGDPHMTITQDALDLTVQPSPRHQIRDHLALQPGLTSPWTSDPQPHPMVVTSGFQDYTTAQTSSLEDTPGPSPPILTSDGCLSTYSWQAGGTHSTGILSCLSLQLQNTSKFKNFIFIVLGLSIQITLTDAEKREIINSSGEHF